MKLWIEGFDATGESGVAKYLGDWPGETVEEAARAWATSEPERLTNFRPHGGRPAHWGCRIFGNEDDARESFG